MGNKTSHDSDVSFIAALAELLRDNDLTELQVKRDYGENDSLNVRVSRQMQTVVQASVPAAAPPAHPVAPAAAPEAPAASDAADPASHPGAVTSPMVGTVYMAPEPGAAPFATVGATIKGVTAAPRRQHARGSKLQKTFRVEKVTGSPHNGHIAVPLSQSG